MIIYNITTKTDWSIHEAWFQWMQEEHIPEILATGMFHDCSMMRLLEVDDEEGPTYAVQFLTHAIENYYNYMAGFAPFLRQKSMQKWGDQFISFRSLMQTVN